VRLTYVVDGAMELAARGFFPQVPDSYWSTHPETVTSNGRVAMSVGGLLVEREGMRLLIDAGLGNVVGEVAVGEKYVGVANSGALPDVLAALDRSCASIDAVAFTHLHVDHTGWAFGPGPDGVPRKFFHRAQYFVAAQEWAPHARGELVPGAPPRSAVIEPLAGLHTPIVDGQEVFPGVRALVSSGHSPGHTSYVISSTVGRIIVFGDAFHVPAQLSHPDWTSLPDIDGASVLAARRRLLGELTQPSTLAFAYHFGDQPFGCVVRDETGAFAWSPVPTTILMKTPRALAEQ
jgi:glyoxylase-like metal-dependent hydrolase (beta-lactamase superfamily II)